MSLWRTGDNQHWVLIALARQELERAERVRRAMQRALAEHLEHGVTIGVLTGKLAIYLNGQDIPDRHVSSAAVIRSQTRLAQHYGLEDTRDARALAAALADDFAGRYQDELAREQMPDYTPEPVELVILPGKSGRGGL
jgi:cytosine/adenosine deaminase-related metal-dependent hydrolase